MKFIIRNIRLCCSLVLIMISISFVTCNKPVLIKKEIPTYPGETLEEKHLPKDTISANDSSMVNLYLTFDDGPTRGSRNVNALTISDSININVFVIGRFVFKSDSSRELFELYHDNPFIEIGNHSFTHADGHYHLYYKNADEVKNEFLMNQDILQLDQKIARLPGRNCWTVNSRSRFDLEDGRAISDSLAAYGYRIFGWDIEWTYDSTGRVIESAQEIFERIMRMAEKKNSFMPGNIVLLCHDPMLANSDNESELRSLIREIKMTGHFRFEHLSRYPR